MGLKALIFVLAVASVAALQSHGPAHKEKDLHARQSQKMAENLWHLQQQHLEKLQDALETVNQKHSARDAIKQMSRREALSMKNNLHNMYHPNPAISLLEKISYSKPVEPTKRMADESKLMMELFGMDEGKATEEIEHIHKIDPDLVKATSHIPDDAGFSEEAMKKIIAEEEAKKAKETEATQNLMQLEEGLQATTSRRSIDWKKWEKFVLQEFEAARLTGELDAEAHKLAPLPQPADELLQTAEGNGVAGFDNGAPQLDKMCGCEISLAPVCGSDGRTYPSKCFAECASLVVSHEGPCLSLKEIEKPGSFRVISKTEVPNPNGKPGEQALIAVPEIADSASEMFSLDMEGPDSSKLQPGVDFASLPSSDALAEAKEAQQQNLLELGREINMPFSHPITQKQFEGNVEELSRIAQQFEPAMRSEKLANCDCHGSYSPVCGLDHQTYPSPCYASCVGMGLRHSGPCRDDELAVAHPGQHTASLTVKDVAATVDDVRDPLCFCSLKEKSVCGVDGVTYTNRCFADCVHVKIRSDGPCYTVRA